MSGGEASRGDREETVGYIEKEKKKKERKSHDSHEKTVFPEAERNPQY